MPTVVDGLTGECQRQEAGETVGSDNEHEQVVDVTQLPLDVEDSKHEQKNTQFDESDRGRIQHVLDFLVLLLKSVGEQTNSRRDPRCGRHQSLGAAHSRCLCPHDSDRSRQGPCSCELWQSTVCLFVSGRKKKAARERTSAKMTKVSSQPQVLRRRRRVKMRMPVSRSAGASRTQSVTTSLYPIEGGST